MKKIIILALAFIFTFPISSNKIGNKLSNENNTLRIENERVRIVK